jgi:cyanobactin biosynthesis protein (PatB/AcyB/McaB family)
MVININPILSKPVKRPHFVDPSTCVDLLHGRLEDRFSMGLKLVHGANYNDPAPFGWAGAEQVMSSGFARWSF